MLAGGREHSRGGSSTANAGSSTSSLQASGLAVTSEQMYQPRVAVRIEVQQQPDADPAVRLVLLVMDTRDSSRLGGSRMAREVKKSMEGLLHHLTHHHHQHTRGFPRAGNMAGRLGKHLPCMNKLPMSCCAIIISSSSSSSSPFSHFQLRPARGGLQVATAFASRIRADEQMS
jgi:hypothetical protein